MPDTVSELDLAYVAGFFDGEGTVDVSQSWSNRDHILVTGYRLSIVNTNREVLEYVQRILGGVGVFYTSWDGNSAHAVKYQYCVRGLCVIRDVMVKLMPYLIVKKEAVLTMLDLVESRINRPYHHAPLTSLATQALRAAFADSLVLPFSRRSTSG